MTNQEKVKLHFLDETEIREVELSDAVERCNIKLSSLYCEILALDSDMGSVAYLERVAQINKDFIMDWHKTQRQNKTSNIHCSAKASKRLFNLDCFKLYMFHSYAIIIALFWKINIYRESKYKMFYYTSPRLNS